MAKQSVTRLDGESHADLWAHYLRFAAYRGAARDYTGHRFGRWEVVGIEGWGPGGTRWLARCDCGRQSIMRLGNMLKGLSRSCGCLAAEESVSHGMAGTRPYRIWAGMRQRCENTKSDNFPHYGGRGIRVCAAWGTFEGFWADMRRGYGAGLTLERKDVNGHYEPGNCCWIPKAEQPSNLRRTRWISTPRGRMTLLQASRAFGVKKDTLRSRIRYGWPEERLLEGYC